MLLMYDFLITTKEPKMSLIQIEHPGVMLKEDFLDDLDILPGSFAKAIDVDRAAIKKIIDGKRAISADMSLRFGLFFQMSPSFWFNLQKDYDLRIAKRDRLPILKKVVRAFQENKASNYHISKDSKGWKVIKSGGERASARAETKTEILKVAKRMATNSGGGEISERASRSGSRHHKGQITDGSARRKSNPRGKANKLG